MTMRWSFNPSGPDIVGKTNAINFLAQLILKQKIPKFCLISWSRSNGCDGKQETEFSILLIMFSVFLH